MSALDLTPIVQPVLATASAVVSGLLLIYVPMGLAAFQRRTGIMLTDQQRATIMGFVQTSAGNIETKLDQGALAVAHVNVSNPAILAEAQSIIQSAPIAATALGVTTDGLAKMIVGKVDTGPRALVGPAPASVAIPFAGKVS